MEPDPQNLSQPSQQFPAPVPPIPAAQTMPWEQEPVALPENYEHQVASPPAQTPPTPAPDYQMPQPQPQTQIPSPPSSSPPPNVRNMGAVAVSNADSAALEPGEQLVDVVRRHPIGIVGIYAEMFTGVAGIVTLVLLAIFVFFASATAGTKSLIAAAGVFVVAFVVGLLFIATYVYRQCRLLVTDKSLVQVIQKALFSKKISRLSMSNVEDVNVEQRGILASMFNYGTLTIETAGEEDNFVFTLCPNPDGIAHRILEERQAYVRKFGEED